MTEHRLELSGMSCGACERIIERIAEKAGAKVREIDGNTGRVLVEIPEGQEGQAAADRIGGLKAMLAEKGFFEKGTGIGGRGDFSRVVKYVSSVLSGEENVTAESRLLNHALAAAAALLLLSTAVYFFFLKSTPNPMAYIPVLLLSVAAAVSTAFSYLHSASYRQGLSCTNGMMAGMVMGMIPGFMVGAILGATNGMFIGSTAGMLLGVFTGYTIGRNSGIMGALEGVMAGIMAGTMGAMLSVMMLRDNLVPFLFILFASCSAVLGGLSYMLYREQGGVPETQLPSGSGRFLLYALLLYVFILTVAFAGPKAALVYP